MKLAFLVCLGMGGSQTKMAVTKLWLTSVRISVLAQDATRRTVSQCLSGDPAPTETRLPESLNMDLFELAAGSAKRPLGCHNRGIVRLGMGRFRE